MEYIKVEPQSVLGSALIVSTTFIGLVVWLIKWAERQRAAITDRYFEHLEKRERDYTEINRQFTVRLQEQGEILRRQSDELRLMGESLKKVLKESQ